MTDILTTCMTCFEQGHSADDCKEDKNDFRLIGPIAAFIGARLQYPNPNINGQGNPWVSTIGVDQHKEKFWMCRIYCTLADPELVKQKWCWLKGHAELRKANPYYMPQGDFEGDEPTQAFKDACLKHDAMHYRRCYIDMVALVPRLRQRVCSQADYFELLFDNVAELDAWFDTLACQKTDANDPMSFYRTCYHVEGNEKLKALLRTFYSKSRLSMLSD